MWRNLFALIAGGIFGAGLTVSGMVDTVKVQGWLDVFGDWDATLAAVMGGAILPMAVAWRVAARRPGLGAGVGLSGTARSEGGQQAGRRLGPVRGGLGAGGAVPGAGAGIGQFRGRRRAGISGRDDRRRAGGGAARGRVAGQDGAIGGLRCVTPKPIPLP